MTTLAILGAGRVGTAIGRAAVKAGYTVNIAASGAPGKIALIVEIVVPGARAMTTADAVAGSDIVVLALPLNKYRSIDPTLLTGRIVVDAMNYWAPIDGTLDAFEGADQTSSETVAEYLTGARVVKSFNHIGYHELEEGPLPQGDPARRALAVASDDEDAASAVMAVINDFGYDAVNAGPLRAGAAFEPGTVIFGAAHTMPEIVRELQNFAAVPAVV